VGGSLIALLLIPLAYNEKDRGLNKEPRPCVIHRAAAKRPSRKPGFRHGVFSKTQRIEEEGRGLLASAFLLALIQPSAWKRSFPKYAG
jgi:hypothetical protein